MNTQKSITIKQVIELAIEDLRGLKIPADMLDEFGPRISRTLGNLKVCYSLLDAKEKEIAAKANKSQEDFNPDEVESGFAPENDVPIMRLVEEELDDAKEDQLESPIQE